MMTTIDALGWMVIELPFYLVLVWLVRRMEVNRRVATGV